MKDIYNLVVYIVKCSDESYYTGLTNDLERRIAEHNSGNDPEAYTFSRRPVELVFAYGFQEKNLAIQFEKKIKGWSRAKKEALIKWDWEKIHALAQCKNETTHLHFKKDLSR
jgi:putative endonuclease